MGDEFFERLDGGIDSFDRSIDDSREDFEGFVEDRIDDFDEIIGEFFEEFFELVECRSQLVAEVFIDLADEVGKGVEEIVDGF